MSELAGAPPICARLDRVRRSGDGWAARCPAHEDGSPSLSVRWGRDGRTLVYCHAGCATAAVVAALGLTMAALAPSEPSRGR